MGGGGWTADTYASTKKFKEDSGIDDFAYSRTTKSTKPASEWKVHEDLDPKKTNKAGDHANQNVRESLDNDEHPESLAIAVLFDVTGSMTTVPTLLQKKLPELWGLLLRKGYVEHPQVLFGGIGDATVDRVPLQVGQFESDNRSDLDLEKIFLESGGGGTTQESYELAMYFMARHTYIDCYEKRAHRGYLFIIGDEQPYNAVDRHEVTNIIGDTLQAPIPTPEIVAELQQKYDVYCIRPVGSSYHGARAEKIVEHWKRLLGQNVIELEDDAGVCETIALCIGLAEGAIDDVDAGLRDLDDIGSDSAAAVGKALVSAGVGASGAISTSSSPGDLTTGDSGVERI